MRLAQVFRPSFLCTIFSRNFRVHASTLDSRALRVGLDCPVGLAVVVVACGREEAFFGTVLRRPFATKIASLVLLSLSLFGGALYVVLLNWLPPPPPTSIRVRRGEIPADTFLELGFRDLQQLVCSERLSAVTFPSRGVAVGIPPIRSSARLWLPLKPVLLSGVLASRLARSHDAG